MAHYGPIADASEKRFIASCTVATKCEKNAEVIRSHMVACESTVVHSC